MRMLIACIVSFFVVASFLLVNPSGRGLSVLADPASKDGYTKAAPSSAPPSAAKPKSSDRTPTTGGGSFGFGVEREMKESGER